MWTLIDACFMETGATNRPQELDEAARRRLTKRLYIPLPTSGLHRNHLFNSLEVLFALTLTFFPKLIHRSESVDHKEPTGERWIVQPFK